MTRYERLPVTTALRTLVDIAAAGLAAEQIRQATWEALRRGLMTRESLLRLTAPARSRIGQLVDEVMREGR